jgi:protein SCO1/2
MFTKTKAAKARVWSSLILVLAAAPGAWGQSPPDSPDSKPSVLKGQRAERLPPELEGVGITERLNEQLPLDLEFTDEDGKPVKLGDYFSAGRPVLLTLNYYACPMLCTLQLNGLVEGLRGMSWTPGGQFEVVTVSFDPRETYRLARIKKQSYIEELGRPGAAKGWHFLVGKEKSIKALTESAGFHYKWNEDRREFMHVAATYVYTPEGRLSRILYGVTYLPNTLRLSLVEASEGKVGSSLDRILLYCFHYDADAGRYAPAAMNIMRVGGGLTALLIGGVLCLFWMRETRKRKARVLESQS